MPRATMPEATIDENGELMLEEYEIWTPGYSKMSSPPSYPVSAKYCEQPKLSRLVPVRANRRHDLRPLSL